MNAKILLALFLLTTFSFAFSQAPSIEWEKTIGDSAELINTVEQTTDGGYILSGSTRTNDSHCWIIKLKTTGSIEWQKTFGGKYSTAATSVHQTTDGGYIALGDSSTKILDVHGDSTFLKFSLLVKFSNNGNVEWEKSMQRFNNADLHYMQQTLDGGYILGGYWIITDNGNDYNCLVYKLDSIGNVEWYNDYGKSSFDFLQSIRQTKDSGYIIAATTTTGVNDENGTNDYWVLKLGPGGNIEWQKTFGGSNEDFAGDVCQATDGGYAVTGYSYSTDGDVTDNFGGSGCWTLKLTASGRVEWKKTFGGANITRGQAIKNTTDSGYVIAGAKINFPSNGDPVNVDFWVLKITGGGVAQWEKIIESKGTDWALDVQETLDRGYILAGYKEYDIGADGYVVKFSASTLPVELLSFTASKINESVLIKWQTALENNSSYFNIQRSTDAVNFITIAKTPAAGNSSLPLNYAYSDIKAISPLVKNLYYRLEEVDKNGKSVYSIIAKVNAERPNMFAFVAPNPVKDVIHFYVYASEKMDNAEFTLSDINGKLISTVKKHVLLNTRVDIPVNNLAKGFYFLSIKTGKDIKLIKIIKQ